MQRMNIDYRIAKRAGCAANLVEHTLLVKGVLFFEFDMIPDTMNRRQMEEPAEKK
jgi:hypothetical protein